MRVSKNKAMHKKYVTKYIGSKRKLTDWIWDNTPAGVTSVFDAFSGSGSVAYMYKCKGLQVFTNDLLRYSYHAARAIIENNSVRLSSAEIDMLLEDNHAAGTFVQDNFGGIFFEDGVHAVIDSVRANCDRLHGYKKDIALFALGQACLRGNGGFGHFNASATGYGNRRRTPGMFRSLMRSGIESINALVFDNSKANKAYQGGVNEILPDVGADLAYFDPPYATEFSTTNYEKCYHFVDGLMTYWGGLSINPASKVKSYKTSMETVTKRKAPAFFRDFLGHATHIPNWLISYRNHAYPSAAQMREIIAEFGRQSRTVAKDHKYSLNIKYGAASSAKELLFICNPEAVGQSDDKDEGQ